MRRLHTRQNFARKEQILTKEAFDEGCKAFGCVISSHELDPTGNSSYTKLQLWILCIDRKAF
jgi:hypothetical protein